MPFMESISGRISTTSYALESQNAKTNASSAQIGQISPINVHNSISPKNIEMMGGVPTRNDSAGVVLSKNMNGKNDRKRNSPEGESTTFVPVDGFIGCTGGNSVVTVSTQAVGASVLLPGPPAPPVNAYHNMLPPPVPALKAVRCADNGRDVPEHTTG